MALLGAISSRHERERVGRLSLPEVEAELAALHRSDVPEYLGWLSDDQLRALVALSPELAALSDAELLAMAELVADDGEDDPDLHGVRVSER